MKVSPVRIAAVFLWLGAVMASAPAVAGTSTAAIRMVESVAIAGVDRDAVLKIIPVSDARGRERAYADLEARLAEAFKSAGLNVQQDATEPDVYVKFDYGATSISFTHLYGSLSDSAYRMIIATAIDGKLWRESKTTRVLWRTVVDQTGLSSDVKKVIPPLIKAATPWYGRNLTKVGIASILAVCGVGTADAGHITGSCTRAVMPLH